MGDEWLKMVHSGGSPSLLPRLTTIMLLVEAGGYFSVLVAEIASVEAGCRGRVGTDSCCSCSVTLLGSPDAEFVEGFSGR